MSGSISKFISTIANYPYSTIKVNLQGKKSRKGIIFVILEIYVTYGFKGFYKGIGSKLIGTVLNMAIMMVLYEKLKHHLRRSFKKSKKDKQERYL